MSVVSRTSLKNIGPHMILVCSLKCVKNQKIDSLCRFIILSGFIYLDAQQKISESDKGVVREHILGFVAQVPPFLRYSS